MMDRIQTSVISVLICAAMVFCFPFSASAESYDYIFTYKLNTDGTAKITGYEGNPIHMVIPAESMAIPSQKLAVTLLQSMLRNSITMQTVIVRWKFLRL